MEVGMIKPIDIDKEMQQSYLDYAMSVIVSRALPDARDGLKPVHRRILYALHDMGIQPGTPFKKSARIVGEVLGKYHPHGDMAVYDAMARMAQTFSMRYPLVDGQGNFGSIDGDSPAAMRYTEARMTDLAASILTDINKDTVDFNKNFDESLSEPNVLPSASPNLLLNGATGIAVGMSTSVPPHNLREVVDALIFMLEKWTKIEDISVDELMRFIKGPDFPTGGMIIQAEETRSLAEAYGTGRGRIQVRARAHVEEMGRGRHRIIVTELPYMTNKASLISRIALLTRDGKLEGLSDLRDESDRQGMRIVIELSKTVNPEKVLEDLYRKTPMQSTFSIILLALVKGEPRMLSLKAALREFLEHRMEIVKRRSQYDLKKAELRAKILDGLLKALNNLDDVINIIRRSRNVTTARTNLMSRLKIDRMQAQAILDMPLKRLTSLERRNLEQEFKSLQSTIKNLKVLLQSSLKRRKLITDELIQLKEKHGDRRRTQIIKVKGVYKEGKTRVRSHIVPEQRVWVSATEDGLLSRTIKDAPPRLSGKSSPAHVMRVNTRDTLYVVATDGSCSAIPVHSLPEENKPSDGLEFHRVTSLRANKSVATMFCLPPKNQIPPGWHVVTTSRKGMLKKTDLAELPGPSATSFAISKVNKNDSLGWVTISDGKSDILLAASSGYAIRFSEDSVRPMGLASVGVRGMKLKANDELVASMIIQGNPELLFILTNGFGKRVNSSDFPIQGRYGQGVVSWKLSKGTALVGVGQGKGTTKAILQMKKYAAKMIRFDEAPLQKRTAQKGKRLIEIKEGDQLIDVTIPKEEIRFPAIVKPKSTKKPLKNKTGKTTTPKATGSRKRKPASKPKTAGKRKTTARKKTKTKGKKDETQLKLI